MERIFMCIALVCAVIVLTLSGVFLAKMVEAIPETDEYPSTMLVVCTDRVTDEVTLQDSTGHLWVFNGVEDWMPGDCASVIMNNNGTAEIVDDAIVKVRYSCWNMR